MEILILERVNAADATWAGKPVRGKLSNRPVRRGISVLVRVITRPDQRPCFDMAKTEAQSLVPQIFKFLRLVKAGNRQMIL